MSLFKDYIEETYPDCFVLETDDMLCKYTVREESIHIDELYVRNESRKTGIAAALLKTVEKMALDCGKTYITCCVYTRIPQANINTVGYIKYGFNIIGAENGFINFRKDLKAEEKEV